MISIISLFDYTSIRSSLLGENTNERAKKLKQKRPFINNPLVYIVDVHYAYSTVSTSFGSESQKPSAVTVTYSESPPTLGACSLANPCMEKKMPAIVCF